MATVETVKILDPQGVQDLSTALFAKTELQLDARIVKELTEGATDKQTPSALLVKTLIEALQAKDVELEGKVEQVKTDVEGSVTSGLEDLTNRITAAETTVGEHGTRLDTAEGKITTVEGNVQETTGKVTTLETQMTEVTGNVAAASTALQELQNKVAALTHLKIETVVGSIDTVEAPASDVLYFQKDNDDDPTWILYIYHVHDGNEAENHWVKVGDTSIDLVDYWRKDDIDAMKEALGWKDIEPMSDEQITAAVDAAFTAAFPK